MARHLGDSSASQPVRESWSSRALKIAAKYLEDPQKWAAQDKFGKGLTVCQREVDPGLFCSETPKIPKNLKTGKIIKILLLMSESLSAHIINTGILSQYEHIAVCYITFVHV